MSVMEHRVKVYCLNDDGTWDDKGVGHVILDENVNNGARIVVLSETDNNSPLLISRILVNNNYQRQGMTNPNQISGKIEGILFWCSVIVVCVGP